MRQQLPEIRPCLGRPLPAHLDLGERRQVLVVDRFVQRELALRSEHCQQRGGVRLGDRRYPADVINGELSLALYVGQPDRLAEDNLASMNDAQRTARNRLGVDAFLKDGAQALRSAGGEIVL